MINIRRFFRSPLTESEIQIRFALPLVTTELTQTFLNDSKRVIEACYQFPLPRTAVLGDVQVMVDGKEYTGQVLEKTEAQNSYEEGIAEGKRAVLIRDTGDGLYELSLGNLAPGEKAVISLTVHQLSNIEQRKLRYFMPTVIAPRYGERDFFDVPEPQNNALADYPFKALVDLPEGSTVSASSHPMNTENSQQISFCGHLNQDISFSLELSGASSLLYTAPLGDRFCTLGSVIPHSKETESRESPARAIQLLVDCSGSMDGVSITHVKEGLEEALNELSDPESEDPRAINLIRYGSRACPLYDCPKALSSEIRDTVGELNADLGGTEIGQALIVAVKQLREHEVPGDIILLTDGQVWEEKGFAGIIETANRLGIRIFCVGVGYAISESFLQKLSCETRGSLTLVNPHENMADALMKVFAQSRYHSLPYEVSVKGTDPDSHKLWHAPSIFPLQSNPLAILSDQPVSEVVVYDNEPQQELTAQKAPEVAERAVAQLVAKLLVDNWDDEQDAEAVKLATQANIISRHTSFSMVSDESVQGADGMPELVEVPQMLKLASRSCSAPVNYERETGYLDVPAFLRRTTDDSDLYDDLEIGSSEIDSGNVWDLEPVDNISDATYAEPVKQGLTDMLKMLDRQLDRRSRLAASVEATLSYAYLGNFGVSQEEIAACGLESEQANCAAFLLKKAREMGYTFNLRVEKLLMAKESA